jgi:eukaryotic-like serine/threonine-protein kinase
MNEPRRAQDRVLVPRPRNVVASEAPPDTAIARGATLVGVIALSLGLLGASALGTAAWFDAQAAQLASAAQAKPSPLHLLAQLANLPFLADPPWPTPLSIALVLASLTVGAVLLYGTLRLRTRVAWSTTYWLALTYLLCWAQDPTGSDYGSWLQGRGWVFGLVVLVPVVLPAAAQRTWLTVLAVALAPAFTLLVKSYLVEDTGAALLTSLVAVDGLALLVVGLSYGAFAHVWTALSHATQQPAVRLVELESTSARAQTWFPAAKRFKRDVVVDIARVFPLKAEALSRFQSDAQLACNVCSPHAPIVLDYGTSTLGEPYCVRERVEGYSFETLVNKDGPQVPERVIFLLEQVCHALAEAHALGLVHGDLEPRVLWVTPPGNEVDQVKVLNLGQASWKAVPNSQPDAHGTNALSELAYRAPERNHGKFVPSDATDIYALGCIGYWLLVGRPPFIGELEAIERHHSSTLAPTVSQLSVQGAPKDLERVLHDCLAKNPSERIANMTLLRKRLLACAAATHWTQQRARAWWQANRAPIKAKPGSKRDPLKFTLRTLFDDE